MHYIHIEYLVIPNFKDKNLAVFCFQFHSIKKLTSAKNFWQCLEQAEIQPVCQKNAFLYVFLMKNLWV